MLATNIDEYQITYGTRLFNHLSISLGALQYFNASGAQLGAFYQHYSERLDLRCAQQEAIDPMAQQSHALFEYYHSQLTKLGVEQALNQELDSLLPGIVAGGFYAINRLANALGNGDLNEIAWSLVCWRVYYLELGPITPSVSKPPTSILRNIAKLVGHFRFPAGNTCDRMKSVLTLVDYQNNDHQPQKISLEILADATIKIYQMSGDFTMMHALTGTASLKVLLPYFSDEELALRYFWQGCVVAYISTGSAAMTIVEPSALIPWPDIFEFCCQSSNEHLIELCRACHQLDQILDHDRCHQVASKQVYFNR